MIRRLILCTLCAIVFFQLKAQNINVNKSIFIQSGIVNVLNGYNLTAGFEKIFGSDNLNGFDAAINFQDVNHSYSSVNMIINENSYFVNIGYKRYFDKKYFNNFLPYASLGILGGITYIDENNNGMFNINKHNEFLYGALTNIGIEYKLNKINPTFQLPIRKR